MPFRWKNLEAEEICRSIPQTRRARSPELVASPRPPVISCPSRSQRAPQDESPAVASLILLESNIRFQDRSSPNGTKRTDGPQVMFGRREHPQGSVFLVLPPELMLFLDASKEGVGGAHMLHYTSPTYGPDRKGSSTKSL